MLTRTHLPPVKLTCPRLLVVWAAATTGNSTGNKTQRQNNKNEKKSDNRKRELWLSCIAYQSVTLASPISFMIPSLSVFMKGKKVIETENIMWVTPEMTSETRVRFPFSLYIFFFFQRWGGKDRHLIWQSAPHSCILAIAYERRAGVLFAVKKEPSGWQARVSFSVKREANEWQSRHATGPHKRDVTTWLVFVCRTKRRWERPR